MTATAQPAASTSPYLSGIWEPVQQEMDSVDLEVTGTLPAHLDGRYLRNGPNPAAEVDPATYHLFSGDAMVHGLSLREGKAQWYRNRWVRTPSVSKTLGETRPAAISANAGMGVIGPNTNVLGHAGRTLALVEGGSPITNSPKTSTPSEPAISMAPSPAGTPPTRTPIQIPVKCTPSHTLSPVAARFSTR